MSCLPDLETRVSQAYAVQHTRRLAAHECYQVASAIYRQYQHLAEAGVPGAMTRYNGLKSRFAGNGGGRPKDEATV